MSRSAIAFVALLLLGSAAPAQVQNKPTEELKLLEAFVGSFTVESTIKPSPQFPDGLTAKGVAAGKWTLDGFFIRWEGATESPKSKFEWSEMITYDRWQKKYKRFTCTSDGTAALSYGVWDEQQSAIAWRVPEGEAPPRWIVTAKTKLEKTRITHSVFVMNEKGEVVRDSTTVMTRKP